MTGTSHRLRSHARAPRMLEIAALMTLAIAHPIADVLVRAPEFFIAHRFERTGLVTLGVLLFAGLPAVAWGVEWFMGRASSRAAQVFRWGLMGVLVALISFQAMKYLSVRAAIGLPVALVLAVGCCLAYARAPVARQFMAFLIPAPLVAAVVFFASAPVARLMQTSGIDVVPPGEATMRAPIVFVVFDQLPLVSLLDDTGDVDAGRYPHFAALAATSTWFRHAMAASDSTAWALPPLLTGRVPDPDRLPTAVDTPGTLFSLFAATHDLHVEEPITTLCPPRLCPRPEEAGTAAARAVGVVNDLAIVYGHLVLPRTLAAARLPQLTDDWRDFGPLLWHQRWVAHRDDDRRESTRRWVEGLPTGSAPTLSFLHVLLPHEPYVYVPSGNLGAVHRDMPGLGANGRWSGDARLVSLSYQRQLLQVQFVDTLLGDIVGAMQRAGSFDAALLVVTADHGASFRPAMPFKAVAPATVADVGAVPLFIKLPGQHAGAEVHTLAQAVDVLPTVATALRRAVPWDVDGRDVLGSSAAGADRVDDEGCIFTARARRRLCVDRDTLHGSLLAAIRNRQWLAGTRTAATRVPEDVIGTAVADVAVVQSNQLRIHVDGEAAIANGADNFVPAYVSGILQRDDGPAAGSQVAIAVDGVVMATADVFDEEEAGRQGFWAALLPVDVMEEGAGEIAIFEIASVDPLELRTPDNGVSDASAPLNVVDPGVQVAHGVEVSGLHEFEWDGGVAFRWTNGAGRFVLPTRTVPAHAVLDVAVRMGGHPERQFTIRVNDCLVFDGRLPEGRWAESLPLDGCMGEDVTTVVVESDTFKPGAEDTRVLGVALESIVFSDGGGAGTAARGDR